jgi:NTE family protein
MTSPACSTGPAASELRRPDPDAPLIDWLGAGPYTLALSAGFFGFFAHAGVVAALEEAGRPPAAVAGASAGALIAGLWASGRDASALAAELFALRRADFWDVRPGPGLLAGAKFRARLERTLGARDFAGCRVPAAISVFDLGARRTAVLTEGDLAGAIHASCALPFLFHPVARDGRRLSDGGIADRHGLAGVPEGARVLSHLLVSRSPWRRRSSPGLRRPDRHDTACLRIDGLPRVGPFRLEAGRAAFEVARRATAEALGRPARAILEA